MGRRKVPKADRLSKPIFVLLKPAEKRFVDALARRERMSRGAVLREAFRRVYHIGSNERKKD